MTEKETLLKLADGAKLLATQITEKGLDNIGTHKTFYKHKPVCAVGHIIELAGLSRVVIDSTEPQEEYGAIYSNETALNALGVLKQYSGLHATLGELTSTNDRIGRSPEEVIQKIQAFETELRTEANTASEAA